MEIRKIWHEVAMCASDQGEKSLSPKTQNKGNDDACPKIINKPFIAHARTLAHRTYQPQSITNADGVRTRQHRHAVPAGRNEPADEHGLSYPGGEGYADASRQNVLPAGGDLAASPAESSRRLHKAPARPTRIAQQQHRRLCRLSPGQQHHYGADNIVGCCYLSVLLPVPPI